MTRTTTTYHLHTRHLLRTIAAAVAAIVISIQATAQTIKPWTQNASRPYQISNGLIGHHLAVWPSHGRYYKSAEDTWKWQRTQIYCTTEDVFTQTIVIPYLIPMLENAGANVFVPRERDWQTEMSIVDNDMAASGYTEQNSTEQWKKAPRAGYGIQKGLWHEGDRPFARATARMITTTQGKDIAKAVYKPNLAADGRYAVYVSYQTVEGSVDDAEYIVVHQGQRTTFRVNQQMGSGTWVYLGTFDFDSRATFENYVMVTNNSSRRGGIVTTDAVRFGGGMGDHERGGRTSHLPRAMEAARYYAQFAGAPKAVVVSKGGSDDYGDDINTRSLMANWLSYGSKTNPTEKASARQPAIDVETTTIAEAAAKAYLDSIQKMNIDSFGMAFPDSISQLRADSVAQHIADSVAKIPFQQINVMKGDVMTGRVPIELQLAVHSDAGYKRDFKQPFGTLAICTSDFNSHKLASGQPRKASFELACDVLYGVTRELEKKFGTWEARDIWDKNYSETRLPAQPSIILETLSHESFADLKLAHDPYFKFVMARAIYKALLKYMARYSKEKVVVQPLTPHAFAANDLKANVVTLSWKPTDDPDEKTATTDAYILYTRVGDRGYDNGRVINATSARVPMRANTIYRFKVAAINKGGESFPTEELVAMYCPESKERAMIINGFHRLSSPAVVETDSLCGFDLDADAGLSYGKTPAWVGHQQVFDKTKLGHALGATGSDLLGRFTAGNDFNYAYSHADALRQTVKMNIISTSAEAFNEQTDLQRVSMLDILLGNEKNDGHSLLPYKTFSPQMQNAITAFANNGGKVLVSGSYVASDMQAPEEQQWLQQTLGVCYHGSDRDSLAFRTDSITDIVRCGDLPISVYRHVNGDHYASVASDIISQQPADANGMDISASVNTTQTANAAQTANAPMTYASGASAAVFRKADGHATVTLGFPFECIKTAADRKALMQRITDFLLK